MGKKLSLTRGEEDQLVIFRSDQYRYVLCGRRLVKKEIPFLPTLKIRLNERRYRLARTRLNPHGEDWSALVIKGSPLNVTQGFEALRPGNEIVGRVRCGNTHLQILRRNGQRR